MHDMSSIDSKLINFQQKLGEECSSILKLVKEYSSKSSDISMSLKTISDIYESKVKTLTPQIMVYGIYNAGKSSIINALIREEKAKVADVPTTDRVDMYEWNGYQIADTPGVGAPIQHEKVTNQQLKKADVVLFVMSTSGSFEYEQNYSRMKDIIDTGKRVLIILNDKEGYLGTDDEQKSLATIKSKIVNNMKQVGIENSITNIQDKYQIIVVNADDAKEAIEKGDAELYQASNMPELEKAITYELKNANSFIVLRNAINEIEVELKYIAQLLSKFETREELQDLNQILNVIRERKISLRQEMQSFISIKTNRMGSILPSKIWAVKEDESKINDLVEKDVNSVADIVQRKLNDEFLTINDEIKNETSYFVEKMQKLKVDFDKTINVPKQTISYNNTADTVDNTRSDEIDKIINVAKEIYDIFIKSPNPGKPYPIPGPIYTENVNGNVGNAIRTVTNAIGTKEAVSAVAPNLVKTIMPAAIGKTVVGKALGTVIPYVGPIIAGIQILSSLFGDDGENERLEAQVAIENAREQQRLQAEEQARQSLKQQCEFLAEDVKDSLILSVNEIIRNTLGEIEKAFTDQIAGSKDDSNKLTNDINMVSNTINNLNRIRTEIEV